MFPLDINLNSVEMGCLNWKLQLLPEGGCCKCIAYASKYLGYSLTDY